MSDPPVFPIEGQVRGDQLLVDDFIHDGPLSARVVTLQPPLHGLVAVVLNRDGVEWVAELPADTVFAVTRLVDENLER